MLTFFMLQHEKNAFRHDAHSPTFSLGTAVQALIDTNVQSANHVAASQSIYVCG